MFKTCSKQVNNLLIQNTVKLITEIKCPIWLIKSNLLIYIPQFYEQYNPIADADLWDLLTESTGHYNNNEYLYLN